MSLQTLPGQTITEPVTLAAVKDRIKLTSTADDVQITGLITAAREFAERISNRCLAPRQFIDYRDGFPYPGAPVIIPAPPLVSVDLVEYLTIDPATELDVWATWAATEYRVANSNVPALLTAKSAYPCPVRAPGNVRVTFTAGAATMTGTPPALTPSPLPQHWQLNIEDIAVFMYENAGVQVPTSLVTIPKIHYF
jgi:uncharacterized phiE125 gp8 family phage protein